MAILTAQQLKARETPEFTIDLGGGQQVRAKRPDLQLLVLKGVLPTPLLDEVVGLIGNWVGADLTHMPDDVIEHSEKLLDFVDTLVCAALVEPRVVRAENELAGDALLVSDLTVATKKRIVVEVTNALAAPEVVADAKTFPGGEPGAGTGPDVPALQPAAV